MKYRREIDGLRAVAVLPVILFHGGFKTFDGGFIGVDVFFVISGYLITSLMLTEKQAGTFSLTGFYERRARRILPLLLLVTLSCFPFAWALMLPNDMKAFAASLLSVCAFVSNMFFWRHSGYFDVPAHSQPLLHTWSLGVEEQYYLIAPVFLALTWRFGLRWTNAILIVIAGIGLFAAQKFAVSKPEAAFYLFPTRAWELMFGATTATILFDKEERCRKAIGSFLAEALGILGLLLIAYAVFWFDSTTAIPGLPALIPTVGAVLIVVFAGPQTFIGRLLGHRVLVGIGLISYSAYLWHWPLFVFARLQTGAAPSFTVALALALCSFGLAFLSWKYVERPVRKNFARRTVVLGLCVPIAAVLTLGLFGIGTQGFASRFTDKQLKVLAFGDYPYMDIYAEGGGCFLPKEAGPRSFTPPCNGTIEPPRAPVQDKQSVGGVGVLVWGDSHAAALSRGMRRYLPRLMQFTAIACPPLLGFVSSYSYHCKEVNDFVLQQIELLKPVMIVLHGRWPKYPGLDFETLVSETAAAIRRASPSSTIVIVGSVPQWDRRLPVMMAEAHAGLDDGAFMRPDELQEFRGLDDRLRAIAALNGAQFFSALDTLCRQDSCQTVAVLDGQAQPTSWDQSHLTVAAAAGVALKLLSSIGPQPN